MGKLEKKDSGRTKGVKKAAPAGGPRKKRFVLVVDNSQRDATYTSVLLQNLGYTATVARSGEEALEMIALMSPALVVTELVLPGLNGIDLFQRLAGNPSMPAPPLIITTKFTDTETEDRCRRIGCAGCLNKPLQTDDLYRAVQQAVEPTPRQNIRVPVLLPTSLDDMGSGSAFVTMLSDEGLFLRMQEPPATGSRHMVAFLLGSHLVRVDAAVLYAYRFEEHPSKEPGAGMKFLNLTPVDKDVIQTFIREQVHPGITPALSR